MAFYLCFEDMTMFGRILRLARPFWLTIGIVAGLILVMAGLKQVDPLIAKAVTDTIINGESVASANYLIRLLLILLVYHFA